MQCVLGTSLEGLRAALLWHIHLQVTGYSLLAFKGFHGQRELDSRGARCQQERQQRWIDVCRSLLAALICLVQHGITVVTINLIISKQPLLVPPA